MRRSSLLVVLGVSVLAGPVGAQGFLIESGERVLILGDSITHDGTYVSIFEAYLYARFPRQRFDVIGVGLSSETASGLSETTHPFPRPDVHTRLDSALAKTSPQVVIACYGMNDGIYHPQSPEHMAAYQRGIIQLIDKSQAAGARLVVVLTPPPFDPTGKELAPAGQPDYGYERPYEEYDDVLADYARWIVTIERDGVVTGDVHTALTEHLATERRSDPGYKVSGDGVHPNGRGHMIIAATLIRALGGSSIGTTAEAFEKLRSNPYYQLVDERRTIRSDAWRTHIGHRRPDVPVGLPIEEAGIRSAELDRQIRSKPALFP